MTSTPTSALPKSTDEVPKFKVVILGKKRKEKKLGHKQHSCLSLECFYPFLVTSFIYIYILLYRSYGIPHSPL
jgi:hypothetical protein